MGQGRVAAVQPVEGCTAAQCEAFPQATVDFSSSKEDCTMMRTGVGLALLSAVAWSFWESPCSVQSSRPPRILAFFCLCGFYSDYAHFIWHSAGQASTGLVFALTSGICVAIGIYCLPKRSSWAMPYHQYVNCHLSAHGLAGRHSAEPISVVMCWRPA
jgi:hypothetical protein